MKNRIKSGLITIMRDVARDMVPEPWTPQEGPFVLGKARYPGLLHACGA